MSRRRGSREGRAGGTVLRGLYSYYNRDEGFKGKDHHNEEREDEKKEGDSKGRKNSFFFLSFPFFFQIRCYNAAHTGLELKTLLPQFSTC